MLTSRYKTSVALSIIMLLAAGLFSRSTLGETTDNPSGRLFRWLAGSSLEDELNIGVLGWAQGTAIYNENGTGSVTPQGFFNTEEGINLNQIGLMVCRGDGCPPYHFGPKHNLVSHVGPFPAPRSEEIDVGFNATVIYGEDNQFLRTLGFDDFDFDDGYEEKLAIPQWYVDFYLPVLDGTTLLAGSFQTSLENEIGYPFDPPAWFATHSYAFQHGPAKHVGALMQTKIPTPQDFGLLSVLVGSVLGWNNLEDKNDDLDLIAGLRWRSPDFRTWIDIETIYGNGENDFASGPSEGGSPYFVLSSTGEDLYRFAGYLVANHTFSDEFQVALEGTYGFQEGGDLSPAPIFITTDSEWYGANLNFRFGISDQLSLNVRGEWFRDEDGAHVLWAGAAGDVYAGTANLTWRPADFVRVRPEVRFDIFDGAGSLFAEGTKDQQFLGLIDVVVQY